MESTPDSSPSLYLVTFLPLVATAPGREASRRFNLPPFIDGSVRREPDFQATFPTISCLCRADKFAPRLRVGDHVVYMTKKGPYGTAQSHRRLVAVLRVAHLFDSHEEAADWHRTNNLPLPSNCMVPGNPPNDVSRSHRDNKEHNHLQNDKEFTRLWDAGYQARAKAFGRFVVCEPLVVTPDSLAPQIHDQDLLGVFGVVPPTLNPKE